MKPGQRRPLGGDFRARAAFDNRPGHGEAGRQRQGGRERPGDGQPIAVDEREKDPREPEDENQARETEANRRPAHRHESDHENGERNRGGRVDPARGRRPRQSVAGHEIADRGCEHFRARRNAIERRCECVRRARRRDPNDDDFVAQSLRIDLSAEDLGRADAPDASRRPVETHRHVVAEVHFSQAARDLDAVGARTGSACSPWDAAASAKDGMTPSGV